MITLKTYNRKQLQELINSEMFGEFRFIPISKHRAISQINNPRATHEDTLLILAFSEGELAGYIGILPDDLFLKKERVHIGWLSTIFVHSDFRGKKIAQILLAKACEEYVGNIMLTEYTPVAEAIYKKSGFFEEIPFLEGKAFHYYFNLATILPTKNDKLKKAVPLLKGIDSLANFCIEIFTKKSKSLQKLAVSKIMDAEISEFINNSVKASSFQRKSNEINWIIGFPWILDGKKDSRYCFSDFEHHFQNVFLKVYHNNSLQSVLLLSVRKNGAKLLFNFGTNNFEEAAECLHSYLLENKICSLISFDENINRHLEKLGSIYTKARIRKFMIHKAVKTQLGNGLGFIIYGGDGDAAFT